MTIQDAIKARKAPFKQRYANFIGGRWVDPVEGRWFDKPPDIAAARRQLQELRGRTHELVTAVACHRHGSLR